MSVGEVDAPRYAESIPAVTAPVRMPNLVPGRASYVAGLITGGALLVVTVTLLVVGLVVLS